MAFFNSIKNIFSSSGLEDHWHVLQNVSQVESLVEHSQTKPQLIYKHSYRCGTCFFAKNQIDKVADNIARQADLHFVNVVDSRLISNHIAEKLGVRHKSPQLLLVSGGKVVWHISHGQIKSQVILAELQQQQL